LADIMTAVSVCVPWRVAQWIPCRFSVRDSVQPRVRSHAHARLREHGAACGSQAQGRDTHAPDVEWRGTHRYHVVDDHGRTGIHGGHGNGKRQCHTLSEPFPVLLCSTEWLAHMVVFCVCSAL
jgi:hypothetical protein